MSELEIKANKRKLVPIVSLLIVILLVCVILSITLGRYALSITDIFSVISHHLFGTAASYEPSSEIVLINVRTPRIMAAILVGAAMSGGRTSSEGRRDHTGGTASFCRVHRRMT